tara:strand:+ start:141 stop:311 length:171 start_codon:yes stop_codon:yes gene_type:complete
MTVVRYGAGGVPIIKEIAPVENKKKKQEPLQEILETNPNEEDGFEEDITGEENEDV